MPPLPFYHCRGHCDAIGHGNDSPFSGCTFASEFCLHALRKPFVPPSNKEGGGAPISASTGVRPAAERKPASVCGERHRFLPRTVRDQSGGALAFRRPTAVMRRGPYLELGSGPRFLESPDPNGRTLSGTSAASTWQSGHAPDGRCPEPPGRTVYRRASGNRSRSTFESTLAKGPSVNEMGMT